MVNQDLLGRIKQKKAETNRRIDIKVETGLVQVECILMRTSTSHKRVNRRYFDWSVNALTFFVNTCFKTYFLMAFF